MSLLFDWQDITQKKRKQKLKFKFFESDVIFKHVSIT
jgi:hypothetical protein